MGVGMASYLAPAIIYNAIADLKASNCGGILSSPNVTGQANSTCISGGDLETNPRKRKKIRGLSTESSVASGLERELDVNDTLTSISVQISALQALEALLTVGGALRSDRWRAEVDLILVTVAMNAPTNLSRLQFCNEEDVSFFEESTSHTTADFQLAAYRALLASLLSPCCHRPPYLSQGLALFRRGRQESGTELAEFCAHALLALEPLIHPRSLPYGAPPAVVATGMASGRGIEGNIDIDVEKSSMFIPNSDSGPSILGPCNMAFGSSIKIGQHSMQDGEDDFYRDDEIYMGWLGNGDDSIADQNNLYDSSEMPIESLVQSLTENGELHCSPIDKMENLSAVQPSVDSSVHSIAVGGISNPCNETDIGTFTRDSVETGTTELMGMSEAHRGKVDASQDALLAVSGSKTIDSAVSSLSVPVVAPIENLLCEQANVGTAASSRDTVLGESSMAIHTETNAVEAVERGAIVLESQQQSETRIETEDQPARNLQLPLHLKSHYISSAAESDSDAIPDIVDGDPDTD